MGQTEYVVKFKGDYSALAKDIDKINGATKKLEDDEVIIKLNYDGNIKQFNKVFDEISKKHPELGIQFQYNVNEKLLKQETDKLKQLTDLKLDIDEGKVESKLNSLSDGIKEALSNGMSKDDVAKRLKDFFSYYNTAVKAGAKNIDIGALTNKIDDAFIGSKKDIHDMYIDFFDSGDFEKVQLFKIDKSLNEDLLTAKEHAEDIREVLKSLKEKGASETGLPSELEAVQDEIKILKSDIQDMQEQLKNLSGDAFNDMTQQIKETNQQLEFALQMVSNLKAALKSSGIKQDNSIGGIVKQWQDEDITKSRERYTAFNSQSKKTSGAHVAATAEGVGMRLMRSAIEEIGDEADGTIHSHPQKYAAFSDDDIEIYYSLIQEGITQQIVTATEEAISLDMTKVNPEKSKEVVDLVRTRYQEIDNTLLNNLQSSTDAIKEKMMPLLNVNVSNPITDVVLKNIRDNYDDLFDGIMNLEDFDETFERTADYILKQIPEFKKLSATDRSATIENIGGFIDLMHNTVLDAVAENAQKEYQKVLQEVFTNPTFLKSGETSAIKIQALSDFIDWGSITESATEATKEAADAIKKAQDSNSPAELTKPLGKDFGAGYAEGIREAMPEVIEACKEIVLAAYDAVKEASDAKNGEGNNFLDNFINNLKESLDNAAPTIQEKIKEVFSKIDIDNKSEKSSLSSIASEDFQSQFQNAIDETGKYIIKVYGELIDDFKSRLQNSIDETGIYHVDIEGWLYDTFHDGLQRDIDGQEKYIIEVKGRLFDSFKEVLQEAIENLGAFPIEVKPYMRKGGEIEEVDLPGDNQNNLSSGITTSSVIPAPSEESQKKWRDYNDLVAIGYDRIQKMNKISESGTEGKNSVYDLLRLNHPIWDEVKANDFFNTIPEQGLQRYNAILEVVERIVAEMVSASGLTEEQIISQLKAIKDSKGGYFKANGNDSGWSHFATYSDGTSKDSMHKENGLTYKVYASFDDVKDLNQNVISSLMDELSKAGFKGRLKTTTGSTSFGDKLNALGITDQLVVHGATKQDQEIAYNTIKKYLGSKLSYLGGGIDTPDGSFSETLSSGNIAKYVNPIIEAHNKATKAAKEHVDAEHEVADVVSQVSDKTIDLLSGTTTPSQQFDNEVQQNLVMLENYKNTVAEIDRLKLEPETDETKAKLEELNKLADYFASKITVIRSENGGEVNTSMMLGWGASGGWSERLKRDYSEEQRKDFLNVAKDRTGLQISKVASEFHGISDEISNIEAKSEGLRNALTKDLTESSAYVSKLRAAYLGIAEANDELKTAKPGSEDFKDYTEQLNTFLSKYPELEKFKDALGYYDKAPEFVKSDEWLDFLATLPQAHTYLESIGYDFDKINRASNETPVSTESTNAETKALLSKKEVVEQLRAELNLTKKAAEDLFDQQGYAKTNNKYQIEQTAVDELIASLKEKKQVEESQDSSTTSPTANAMQSEVEVVNQAIEAEKKKFDELSNKISKNIPNAIDKKNKAFEKERDLVAKVIDDEIDYFDILKDSVNGVTNAIEKQYDTAKNAKPKAEKSNNKSSKSKSDEPDRDALLQQHYKELRKDAYQSIGQKTDIQKEMSKYYAELEERSSAAYESASKKTDSLLKKVKQLQNSGKYTDDFVAELNLAQKELSDFSDQLKSGSIPFDEVESRVTTLSEKIENTLAKKAFGSVKQAAEKSLTNVGLKIDQIIAKNSAMGESFKKRFEGLRKDLDSAKSIADVQRIVAEVNKLESEIIQAGKTGKSFIDQIKQRLRDINSKYIAQYFSFQDIIRYAREAFNAVQELNIQMVELAKVSEQSLSQIEDDFNSYANTAKDLGATISDTISATADWARMGYNVPDAKQLAEVALLYKNVGDGIDITAANQSLISTLQGYQMQADEAEHIVDVFNEVANNYAIDTAGIGEALQRSAASLDAANTSLEQSVALVTAANTVVQNPESVGTTFKTLSARLRGAKTDLEELGEEEDEFTQTTSKLQSLIKGLTGFDILEADQKTFKSIYDILVGIGKEWKNLTDIEQASLGEALFGKRNANVGFAILNNIDTLTSAYETAENAAGSARREQENYEKGIEYSVNKAKAALQELAFDALDSDLLKGLIDMGTNAINLLDTIIDKFGLLKTAIVGIAGIIGSQKLG